MMLLLVYSDGERYFVPVPAAPGLEGKRVRMEGGKYVEVEE
jgi:hypothetical protein